MTYFRGQPRDLDEHELPKKGVSVRPPSSAVGTFLYEMGRREGLLLRCELPVPSKFKYWPFKFLMIVRFGSLCMGFDAQT